MRELISLLPLFWGLAYSTVEVDLQFTLPLTFPLTVETWIQTLLPSSDTSLELHHFYDENLLLRNGLSADMELVNVGGATSTCYPKHDATSEYIWDNVALIIDNASTATVFSMYT